MVNEGFDHVQDIRNARPRLHIQYIVITTLHEMKKSKKSTYGGQAKGNVQGDGGRAICYNDDSLGRLATCHGPKVAKSREHVQPRSPLLGTLHQPQPNAAPIASVLF
jgi:hypothetical protein